MSEDGLDKYNFVNPITALVVSVITVLVIVVLFLIDFNNEPDPTTQAVNELKQEVVQLKTVVIKVNNRLVDMEKQMLSGICTEKDYR